MTAVINNDSTLPRFHAWNHSLDQSQGTKIVNIEQLLWHVNRNTFQGTNNPNTSVIDWEYNTFYVIRNLKAILDHLI